MNKSIALAAAAAIALTATPALAQSSTTTDQQAASRERLGQFLSTLFGDRVGATTSIEAQWAAGRTPLANQRVQFETRVDTDTRAGTITQATATRLKSEYAELVQLESRYAADRRFTTAEQTDLGDRYGMLTQVLAEGAYADAGSTSGSATVAAGKADFDRRVDTALSARRITRTEGTRLKSDYAAAVQIEAGYLRDGRITLAEQSDLDARLDALDGRLGDTQYAAAVTPRSRLDTIARALTSNSLSTSVRTQLRVEHEDLSRLESAYARLSVTADERAYLDRRLADLETRARVNVATRY